jgi:hypothetical protein
MLEETSQKVLIALDVPGGATRILDDEIANIEEEVDEVARDLRQGDAHSVIIVTSKAYTRRVPCRLGSLGGPPRLEHRGAWLPRTPYRHLELAPLIAVIQTPHRFRTKRQLWPTVGAANVHEWRIPLRRGMTYST